MYKAKIRENRRIGACAAGRDVYLSLYPERLGLQSH